MLDYLAALHAPDVDLVGFERPSRRRRGPHDATRPDPLLELAQVRAAHYPAGHHLVLVNNLVLDLEAQVGERGPPHRDDVPHPRMTAWLPNAEVSEIVIHEILDSRKLPAIPDQIQEPAHDRAVVLLGSHKFHPASVSMFRPSACRWTRTPVARPRARDLCLQSAPVGSPAPAASSGWPPGLLGRCCSCSGPAVQNGGYCTQPRLRHWRNPSEQNEPCARASNPGSSATGCYRDPGSSAGPVCAGSPITRAGQLRRSGRQ